VAIVDVLDEAAVAEHAQAVVDRAGSIDVSFNLISRGDVQGTRLLEMDVEASCARSPWAPGRRSSPCG
jgi:hypothetical protein